MNQPACHTAELMRSRAARGFSLLEVIVALAILSTSTVLLLNIFTTAEKHSVRGEERVRQQILCRTLMNELLLLRPNEIQNVEDEPLEADPNWHYSVESTPTHIEGVMRLRVTVYRLRTVNQQADVGDLATRPRRSFQLVRWFRIPRHKGQMEDLAASPVAASRPTRLGRSLASRAGDQ